MHKIKKYEYPATGIQYNDYWKPNWIKTIEDNNKFTLKGVVASNQLTFDRTRYQNMGFNFSEAAKAAASVNPGISSPASLSGTSKGLTTQSGGSGINGDLLSMIGGAAIDLANPVVSALGGRRADTSGGYEVYTNVADSVAKMGLNPQALAATGGLSALAALPSAFNKVNEYVGKTTNEQVTSGLVSRGYNSEFSPFADKKMLWTDTLFGKGKKKFNKINEQISKTDYQNLLKKKFSDQDSQNTIAANNLTSSVANKNYQQLMGFAKHGGTINPAKLREIVLKVKSPEKPEIVEFEVEVEIEKFANGGNLQNVIPDGALHARKHNLEGDIAEFITDKGIPVITIAEEGEEIINDDGKKVLAEGGEITQHAEIEKEEIIFAKPTTDQLEAYFKQYNEAETEEEKNAILLETGKFLTSEILENTIDNVGLLDKIN